MISLYYLLIIPIIYFLYVLVTGKSTQSQTQSPKIIYNIPTNVPSNIIIDSINRYINNIYTEQTGDISIHCSSNDTIVNDDKISIKSLSSLFPVFVRYTGYGGDMSNRKLSMDPRIISPTSNTSTVPMLNTIIIDKMFFKVKLFIGYYNSSFVWYDILDIGYIDNTNSPQPIQTPSATFAP